MDDAKAYAVHEVLRDGTRVLLRAVRRDDGPRLRRALQGLAPETMYARFFAARRAVSEAELRRLVEADFVRDIVLLATIGANADKNAEEVVIGGVSCFALEGSDPPRAAEIAFTVEEDYQKRGVARLLLRHLVPIARRHGLRRLEAEVLARNHAMLMVLRHSGLPMAVCRESDTLRVTLSLPPDAAA